MKKSKTIKEFLSEKDIPNWVYMVSITIYLFLGIVMGVFLF